MKPDDILPILLMIARYLHGDTITPCYDNETKKPRAWLDCVTVDDGIVRLWYNCDKNSTHIVAISYSNVMAG